MVFNGGVYHKATVLWYLSHSEEDKKLSKDRLRRVAHMGQSLQICQQQEKRIEVSTASKLETCAVKDVIAMLFSNDKGIPLIVNG